MKVNEFYCVATRKYVTCKPDEISVVKTKNGRTALQANHKGYKMFKFVKDSDVSKLKNIFGKKSKRKSKKRSKKRSKRKN